MGNLYLIPATIGDCGISEVIPQYLNDVINTIDYFIVENVRTARRYLVRLGIKKRIDDLVFFELNEHTDMHIIPDYLKPLENNENIGLMSEAGVPCVADPGSKIVSMAHEKNIRVIPLVGPSAILLALMASGLNGQNFAFNGYLPVNRKERIVSIRNIEKRSLDQNQTQVFFETPYRNSGLFSDIISTCNERTQLCIACNITSKNEFILTKPVAYWRKNFPDIDKKPAIFLILRT